MDKPDRMLTAQDNMSQDISTKDRASGRELHYKSGEWRSKGHIWVSI